MDAVIWCGPISAAMMPPDALPPGAKLVTVNAGAGGAIGSSAFGALGASYGGSVAKLLAARGVRLADCRSVTLAAFSAGWGLVESLLRGPEAGEVRAVGAFDAYYTGAGLGRKPGFVAFGERALAGNQRAMLVLTTSSNAGPTYPSASAAVAALVAPWQLRSVGCAVPGLQPPVTCQARGGVVWADYGRIYTHGQHGSVLARAWMRSIITPAERLAPPGAADWLPLVLAAGAAALL